MQYLAGGGKTTPLPYRYSPGCYITHDRGIYDLAQQELIARDPIACDLAGDLTSALELMAMVQSVPEADRAVVNFGKRDCAFDAGLPQPIAHYRNGQELALRAESIVSTGIMDQHCMLRRRRAAMCRSAIFCCSAPRTRV